MVAPAAAEGLRRARQRLTQPGPGTEGRARWAALRETPGRLRIHPYLGSASTDHSGYRQCIVSEHRRIYRVMPDTGSGETAGDVVIVAVFGPGQP